MSEKLSKKEEKVLEKIKKNLKTPKSKTKNKTIVAMVGLVGSGRSRVAEEVSKKIGAELIRSDDVRVELRKIGVDYDNVRPIVRRLASSVLSEGGNVVLDSDHVEPDKRNRLKKIAKDLKAKIYYVQTIRDRDEMIGRIINSTYSKKDFWGGAGSKWNGPKKAAVVKLREMRRRTPHHYTWNKENGGKWVPKKLSFVFKRINTTDTKKIASQVNLFCKKVK